MQPVHRAFIFSVASEDKGAKPLYPLLSVGNVESVYKNGIFAPLALKRLACVAGVKREGGGGGFGARGRKERKNAENPLLPPPSRVVSHPNSLPASPSLSNHCHAGYKKVKKRLWAGYPKKTSVKVVVVSLKVKISSDLNPPIRNWMKSKHIKGHLIPAGSCVLAANKSLASLISVCALVTTISWEKHVVLWTMWTGYFLRDAALVKSFKDEY